MTCYYVLTIQYHGGAYLGWQIQPASAGKTIQGELNKALRTISKSENVSSLGAGRTDAGVHALGQVVKVGMELNIDPKSLVKALNAHLPDDIKIIHAEVSNQSFSPVFDAKSKEYQYRFSCDEFPNPLQNGLIYHYPFQLNFSQMKKACELLIGEHDFTNFYCEGTNVSHYIRRIYECEIISVEKSLWMLPSHYSFRIVGNGFLKQMVRLLIGAILNVGREKISVEDFKQALGPHRVKRLGPVAPPQGLYMVRVNY